MNYIAELNAFYDWLIENPMSGNAQALWHRLMAYCNAFDWKADFQITNGRLVEDLDISRQELDRVRNVLCQKGRIVYKKGNGNQCGIYTIVSFVSQKNANPVTQSGHKAVTNAAQTDTQTVPLDKLNETKLNKTKKDDCVISKSGADKSACSNKFERIISAWKNIGLGELKIIQGTREKMLKARIKQYGESAVIKAIENIMESSFLKGQNKTGFIITFDWLIKPNNFPKVLEGNYADRAQNTAVGNVPGGRMDKITF